MGKVLAYKEVPRGDSDEPKQLVDPISGPLWFCGSCDCSIFYLLGDGGIQCAICGNLQSLAHFDPEEV